MENSIDSNSPQRTLLMAGVSRGIGFPAAQTLVRTQPDIHLVVTARGGRAGSLARQLRAATGRADVSELDCDLSSLPASGLPAPYCAPRLRAAVCRRCPGCCSMPGYSYVPGRSRPSTDSRPRSRNVLANALLIDLMQETLSSPARIVVTTSDTHIGDFRHNLGLVPTPRWRERRPRVLARRHDVDDDVYGRYRTTFSTDPANAPYFELFTGTGRAIREGHLGLLGTGVADLTGRPARPLADLFPSR